MTWPTMREWIFGEAFGRYHLDLGDSNIEPLPLSRVCCMHRIGDLRLDYGNESGLQNLKHAVTELYKRAEPENVLICHGGQEAFSLLIRSLRPKGDGQIICLSSGWAQHKIFPDEVGFSVVNVDADQPSEQVRNDILHAVGANTRAIVLASPDNPTGRTFNKEFLAHVAGVADRYGFLLIVDEEYLMDTSESLACLSDSVAVVSSLSKVHGLPGLRIGWLVARSELVARCTELKHLTTISNSVLCEAVAADVLSRHDEFVARARQLCSDGWALMKRWAWDMPNVSIITPFENVPFAWMQVHGKSSLDVARTMLSNGVLVVPGEVFGRPGHIRLTIARDPAKLVGGLEILKTALAIRPKFSL